MVVEKIINYDYYNKRESIRTTLGFEKMLSQMEQEFDKVTTYSVNHKVSTRSDKTVENYWEEFKNDINVDCIYSIIIHSKIPFFFSPNNDNEGVLTNNLNLFNHGDYKTIDPCLHVMD